MKNKLNYLTLLSACFLISSNCFAVDTNHKIHGAIKTPLHGLVQKMKKTLSPAEMRAINKYTATGDDQTPAHYAILNRTLREGQPLNPEYREMHDHMISGLRKLPIHDGPVTRYVELPEHERRQLVPGHKFTYRSFMSTSAGPDIGPNHNTHLVIVDGHHGRDISNHSDFYNEKEILFAPGAKFKILHREDYHHGTYVTAKQVR